MRVVLLEDIPGLGKKDEIKNVKDGYGRNFLMRRRLAKILTPQIGEQLAINQKNKEKNIAELNKKYLMLKEKIEKTKLTFQTKTGKTGKIFGSITPAKVFSELEKAGIKLEKDQIAIEPIKTFGEHKIKIKLPHGAEAELKVIIESKPPVAK